MTEKIFTLDELKNYDGKEGRKAYIAVDGVVYDVTNVAAWQGGTHHEIMLEMMFRTESSKHHMVSQH